MNPRDARAMPIAADPDPAGGSHSALSGVLDDYLSLSSERLHHGMVALGPLLDDWSRLRSEIAKSNREHGASFNPLGRLKIDETSHSRILGDFLDPNGTHGQGTLFLRPFLDHLGIHDPDSGVWHVTVETGRVDILIWRTEPLRSAVIIENKSNGAVDQPNQIYRYWHQEMYLWEPDFWSSEDAAVVSRRKRDFHVVYLPTEEGKAPEFHSLQRPDGLATVNPFPIVPMEPETLPLAKLMELWATKSAPGIPAGNHRLRAFLSLYHELWAR